MLAVDALLIDVELNEFPQHRIAIQLLIIVFEYEHIEL